MKAHYLIVTILVIFWSLDQGDLRAESCQELDLVPGKCVDVNIPKRLEDQGYGIYTRGQDLELAKGTVPIKYPLYNRTTYLFSEDGIIEDFRSTVMTKSGLRSFRPRVARISLNYLTSSDKDDSLFSNDGSGTSAEVMYVRNSHGLFLEYKQLKVSTSGDFSTELKRSTFGLGYLYEMASYDYPFSFFDRFHWQIYLGLLAGQDKAKIYDDFVMLKDETKVTPGYFGGVALRFAFINNTWLKAKYGAEVRRLELSELKITENDTRFTSSIGVEYVY